MAGCGNNQTKENTSATTDMSESSTAEIIQSTDKQENTEDTDGKLVFDHAMELDYAKNFSVDYYKNGYKLIKINYDGYEKSILTVPEGKKVPDELDKDILVLQMPLKNILISSTPTMSLINAINSLDTVGLTTTKKETWYIDNVVKKMDNNEIIYVGEYKAPDYEVLAAQAPPFAVFSTMLSSVPEVAAKLDELKIPYILDQSTYEEHPLARTEWIKLYGALCEKDEEAKAEFDKQVELVNNVSAKEKAGKTAAIFYITSKGVLYTRNAGDYVTKMLELAGGDYILADLNKEKTGNTKMEMEEFYAKAKDADYIIYIYSLGGKPETLADFTAKSELLKDFKAVKEGNVWCTTPDFFQISNTLGSMIADMNKMFETDADNLTYLFKLK